MLIRSPIRAQQKQNRAQPCCEESLFLRRNKWRTSKGAQSKLVRASVCTKKNTPSKFVGNKIFSSTHNDMHVLHLVENKK